MDPKSSLTGTAFGLGTAFFGPVGGAFASSLTLIGLKEGGDAGQQFALKKGLQIFENLYQFLLQPLVWKWALFDAMRLVNESCKAIKQTIY